MAQSQLIFPVTSGELNLEVMIAHTGKDLTAILAAGDPVPAAVWTKALIDTGTNITCVAPAVLQRLGLKPTMQSKTQTMGGQAIVNLFEVSLTIPPAGMQSGPALIQSDLTVMEMPATILGVDLLIGMDVLLECKLLLDGPARQFVLEF